MPAVPAVFDFTTTHADRNGRLLECPLSGLGSKEMNVSVFVELKFWLLVLFSLLVPALIYGTLLLRRAISPMTVLLLGLALVLVAGFDTYLLQSLVQMAKTTTSLADDAVFVSELTLALYVLPLVFAGVGVNLISHVLIRHLGDAERRFEKQQQHRDRS